jgi:ADP-ribose pyrophosphatase YjhB (NUDIX family)
MRVPILHHMMGWAIQLTVPKRRVGVALVALNQNGQILLLHHVFHPAVPWGLPGGWLNQREAPATGVLRELREETGLTATLGPVIHVNGEAKPDHISIAYVGYIDQPQPIKLSSEIIEAAWFDATLLPTPLNPFVQQAIQAALTKQKPTRL